MGGMGGHRSLFPSAYTVWIRFDLIFSEEMMLTRALVLGIIPNKIMLLNHDSDKLV